ncbi:hypothetical protein Tco_1564590, partial [Tanacetum coccineum]
MIGIYTPLHALDRSIVEIEELDGDVDLDAYVVGQSRRVTTSKRLALEWINEDDLGESSDKNGNVNVNEEQIVNVDEVNVNLNVNNYGIDENYKSTVQDNYDINDYPMEVNVNAYENVNAYKNMNVDYEHDKEEENKHDSSDDKQGRGEDREDFLMDEENVNDEVAVNIEGFRFSVEEKGDDTASIIKRNLRKFRKVSGKSSGVVNNFFMGQEFPNKEEAKDRIKAHAVETRRKIAIVKMIMKDTKKNIGECF